MPQQEPGVRPARPLPYDLRVDGTAALSQKKFGIRFANAGDVGVCFHVRSVNTATGPWSYTVEPNKSLDGSWDLGASAGQYDLSVYGPNGYFRGFKGGGVSANMAQVDVDTVHVCNRDEAVELRALAVALTNKGSICTVTIADNYGGPIRKHRLRHGERIETMVRLESNHGWYDLTVTADTDAGFKWQLAGHVENGRPSISDPAMGRATGAGSPV
jgi:phospholipase C